jgi:hypothetical protein
MKISNCLFFIILFMANSVYAGKETQNGAGIAEQNFAFAYKNLNKILELCWAEVHICLQTPEERKALLAIRNGIANEYATVDQLRFESGELNLNRFLIDGNIRVAVTGSRPGDPIYINTDLLYLRDSLGKLKPLEISMAVSILTHELGHHYGFLNHGFLDLLGAKIRAFSLLRLDFLKWDSYIERSMIVIPVPNVDVTAIHSRKEFNEFKVGSETQLVVSDNRNLYDLKELIEKNLFCPGQEKLKPKGYRLFQLSWASPRSLPSPLDKFVILLKAGVTMTCSKKVPDQSGYFYEDINDKDLQLKLKFALNEKDAVWEFRIDESEVLLLPYK